MSRDRKLTARELKIIEMMADGRTDKEICQSLGVAYSTLRSAMTHVMLKLQARTRPHAVAMYITDGKVMEFEPSSFSRDACPLSPKELEVLLLCCKGLTDAEIGRALNTTVNTIRSTHWVRMRAKLGARNRAHVVALFLRRENGFHGEN